MPRMQEKTGQGRCEIKRRERSLVKANFKA